ncbi:MAG: hypothetical protein COZ46_05945 [Verrucomicrobia bacterium CG_4_10_14_3_um_filter_43_23]|nr:MAG: hypothetical protein AUJ82_02535 [Verrucomicrobia bacterium CG1_02_43_26]PIP59142.1 MAG: hypothetical protein COX01_04940 [Verrucomicrobia bacterium CG22_combo_CG10-13_8_21_14_all_43_17]PIX58047.1 MAG: hypothetical protein COZ46_05945 [Verrucomicrobia bacterium CG_4_10_14_3_um_filter_43_23]PIY62282.1 MAG: hypothetical protein COY94_02515 [Verrucomicrobia bacterium CG_4_10_14_0_8_um_filter_43_34]PJA43748.1 MAG: hypothetical protein CO175_06425 [Verrucomicrobia bacterium CG_4_9_14_3_um_fi
MSFILDIILYLIFASVIAFTAFTGATLILLPRRKLLVYYQDFALRKSKRSLKDEDFKGFYKKLTLAKPIGMLLILLSAMFSFFILS